MSVSVTVEGEIGVFRCTGVLLFQDVMAANDKLLSHYKSDRLVGQLIDLLPVSEYRLTEQEALLLALVDKSAIEYSKPNRIAYLVDNPSIETILETYVQALKGTKWEARLFTDEPQARAWLEGASHLPR